MSTSDHILIYTNQDDPHTDDIVEILVEQNHRVFRLNTDDVPNNIEFDCGFVGLGQAAGRLRHTATGEVVESQNIRSVWLRRPDEFVFPKSLPKPEREFGAREIEQVIWSLFHSLDCYWLSHPTSIRMASWKGEQLHRARRMGFEVPRTLVSNEPRRVRDFWDLCKGNVVFKPLSAAKLNHGPEASTTPARTAPPAGTTPVTEDMLPLLESVRIVPAAFQEYVAKRHELRVTVIGDAVFAAEIHSQEHPATRIDWRHSAAPIPYHAADLPEEIADRCLRFVKSYGLNFGAIDIIVTSDGRYVFLENNPVGQFIFVEKLVPELRMKEALASCLARGSN